MKKILLYVLMIILIFVYATPMSVEAAPYSGITVDGDPSDWASREKTYVGNGVIGDVAMVWDGDYVYIYMQEIGQENQITWSGPHSNGKFVITTDLGYNTNFQLMQGHPITVAGVDGASIAVKNQIYEIAIPTSAIGANLESISFGYYQGAVFVKDVANLHPTEDGDKTFKGITYDGMYGDWTYYPHTLIQYSNGDSDCRGALYADGETLYGHVRCAESAMHNLNPQLFVFFRIKVNDFNNNGGQVMEFKPAEADNQGNIKVKEWEFNNKIYNTANGVYEYYLYDNTAGEDHLNINDPENHVYGKIIITIEDSQLNAEYMLDMEKMAKYYGLEVNDLQLIEARYDRLGQQWVSTAGTSSGPIIGVIACAICALTGAVIWDRRNKKKVKVEE